LSKYDITWKSLYSREFQAQKMVRQFLNLLPDKLFDALFKALDESVRGEIEAIGDMDLQSTLLKKLIFSPKLPLLMFKFILNVIF
ncbi:MAG: hypothetical protein ACXQS8_07920, partial [Candidatus Helarchaeales archaeon]